MDAEFRYEIDLQVNTNSIEVSDLKKIYAIAMTADQNLNMDDFHELTPSMAKETNFTDVWIVIKDIAFVIEVKRYSENCKQQLYDQIVPLQNTEDALLVIPVNFSWKHTMEIMEQVANIQRMQGHKNSLINDFIDLAEVRYPHWFPSKAFSQLPALSIGSNKSRYIRQLRLKQIINHSSHKVLDYNNRMAIGVNFGWASEIIPYFEQLDGKDFVTFTIWPGNTKGQGYHIFDKSLDWTRKKQLLIGEDFYNIDIEIHVKFCHFNKHITSLDFSQQILLKPINTAQNFYNKSGKWNRDKWVEFELFMDEYFASEFDWKKQCEFDQHFSNTSRTYFTVSFGFTVDLYIPYKKLQQIDFEIDHNERSSKLVDDIVDGYSRLIS